MIHTGAILAKGRGAFELDKKNFLMTKNSLICVVKPI